MWYKDWFNSDYYHILYRHRDEKEAESFMIRLAGQIGLRPDMRVLDLPCGRGRHSVFLSKMGLNVTGADLSVNSIEFAKQFEDEKLHFLVHDMLQPFPEKNFDAVLNLFTSLGYFDDPADDYRCIRNMADALKENGHLVIDFLNPTQVLRHMQETQDYEIEGISFVVNKKIENGFVVKNVRFLHDDEQHCYTEKVRLFELNELSDMVNATGLQIIGTFGDYSFGPYNKDRSDRIILIARKY